MVVKIRNASDIEKVKKAMANKQPAKFFDARKYCGAIKFDEDALVIQRKLRDEWR